MKKRIGQISMVLLCATVIFCVSCQNIPASTTPVDSESGGTASLVPNDFRAQETGEVELPKP